MMMDWKAYSEQVASAIKEISTVNPDIVRAYGAFHRANAEATHIDTKTRELIALAVSITLRCDGCINAHTEAALKAGALKEEIVEALGVAIMVNAGATLVYSARTIDAFDAKTAP